MGVALKKRHHNFVSRRPAGQKQRIGSGTYEEHTNRQQRKLVKVFDSWVASLKREIANRAYKGATIPDLQAYLDSEIPNLEAKLAEILTAGVNNAVKIAAGSRAELPAIRGKADMMIRENLELLRRNLIPRVHEKFALGLAATIPIGMVGMTLAIEQQKAVALAIREASAATRAAPAQYAGGYWVAVFETQKTLGGIREDERASQGLAPEPVRWVLDPLAEHCLPSAGFHGCAELAGEYPDGWRSLPTVPAGNVTCRGNCRCHIEVYRDGEWRRGVYDD